MFPKWLTRWFSRKEPAVVPDALAVPAVVDAESAKQAAVFSVYGLLDKAMDVVEFLDRTMKTELKESPKNPAVVFAAIIQTVQWVPDNAKKLADDWARLNPGGAAFEVAVLVVSQLFPSRTKSQIETAVQLGYEAYKLLASFRNAK